MCPDWQNDHCLKLLQTPLCKICKSFGEALFADERYDCIATATTAAAIIIITTTISTTTATTAATAATATATATAAAAAAAQQLQPTYDNLVKHNDELKKVVSGERERRKNMQRYLVLSVVALTLESLFISVRQPGVLELTGIAPLDTMIMVQNETIQTLKIEIDRLKRRRSHKPGCTEVAHEALDALGEQVEQKVKTFVKSEVKRLWAEDRSKPNKNIESTSAYPLEWCYR